MNTPALELRDISKSFPGTVANDHVSLAVPRGRIHALVGENGAGKTTLMRVAYGELRPDAGEVRIQGELLGRGGTARAIALGLGMVHQHFMLVPTLRVFENVVLGHEPRRGAWFDAAAARRLVRETAARFGLAIDPDARVGDLGVGEQQRVEILKVLVRGARVLILDEPTAVLAPSEAEDLFAILRQLVREQHTVLLISHRLHEVLAVSDAVTVLRDGKVVDEMPAAQADLGRLARAIVGREVRAPSRARGSGHEPGGRAVAPLQETEVRVTDRREPVVLRCDSLRTAGKREALQSVSLEVRGGEILGVAGVEGNGQQALAHALLGLEPVVGGSIELHGEDVTRLGTAARRARGLAYVPGDRLREGLIPALRIDENAILGRQREPDLGNRAWLSPRRVAARAETLLRRFEVRPAMPSFPAAVLSGGNQQRLVVGREMGREPSLLLLVQPTRGVDIGGIAFLHERILEARDAGRAVLLVSADLNEILALADRVLVLYSGRVAGTCSAAEATPARLGLWMTGGKESEA